MFCIFIVINVEMKSVLLERCDL